MWCEPPQSFLVTLIKLQLSYHLTRTERNRSAHKNCWNPILGLKEGPLESISSKQQKGERGFCSGRVPLCSKSLIYRIVFSGERKSIITRACLSACVYILYVFNISLVIRIKSLKRKGVLRFDLFIYYILYCLMYGEKVLVITWAIITYKSYVVIVFKGQALGQTVIIIAFSCCISFRM